MFRHPYVNQNVCIKRLREWYLRNGTLIVAFDFDNTVYDFHNKGHDYGEVIELLRKAKQANCFLIVFTGNQDEDFVRSFLKENDIPFDSINEHAPFLPEKDKRARKIYYNVLLDDAAGLKSACEYLEAFLNSILYQTKIS
jgi:hydroxymethylpyrimidine pyrophosphatase-like HAD family hydrolase